MARKGEMNLVLKTTLMLLKEGEEQLNRHVPGRVIKSVTFSHGAVEAIVIVEYRERNQQFVKNMETLDKNIAVEVFVKMV